MKHLRNVILTGVAVAASAPLASAAPISLTFGQTVVTDSNATFNQALQTNVGAVTTSPDGTVYSTSGMITAPTFSGTAMQMVFHDLNNPFNASTPGCGALGCLTFEEQFTNSTGSGQGIEHLTIGNTGAFAGVLTAVGYIAGVGNNSASGTDGAPATVDELTSGNISFNFESAGSPGSLPIAPGSTTDLLIIETNATMLAPGFLSVIDSTPGFIPAMVPAASPATVTPEPDSLILMGTGLLGMAGLWRHRKMK